MKRLVLAIVVLVAACGADGEPERPEGGRGVSVSGDARIGVVGSF